MISTVHYQRIDIAQGELHSSLDRALSLNLSVVGLFVPAIGLYYIIDVHGAVNSGRQAKENYLQL